MPDTPRKALRLRIGKDCQWYAARALNITEWAGVGWNDTRNQYFWRRNPTTDDESPNRIVQVQ